MAKTIGYINVSKPKLDGKGWGFERQNSLGFVKKQLI